MLKHGVFLAQFLHEAAIFKISGLYLVYYKTYSIQVKKN